MEDIDRKVNRKEEAKRLRAAGLAYAEIGDILGITRQAAWEMVRRHPRKSRMVPLALKTILRTGDVAGILQVGRAAVRHWADQGLIPYFITSTRGDRSFNRGDIDRFLKEAERPVRK